jgi:hypothetical protein
LDPFPHLKDGLEWGLLEVWKFPPLGTGFAHGEKICEEHRETFIPRVDSSLALVEPLFCLPRKGEGKQMEPDTSWCDIFDDNGVA